MYVPFKLLHKEGKRRKEGWNWKEGSGYVCREMGAGALNNGFIITFCARMIIGFLPTSFLWAYISSRHSYTNDGFQLPTHISIKVARCIDRGVVFANLPNSLA